MPDVTRRDLLKTGGAAAARDRSPASAARRGSTMKQARRARRRTTLGGLLALLLGLGAAARAGAVRPEGAAAARALLDKVIAQSHIEERVKALIRKLAADASAVREGATRELIRLGSAATALVEQATESDDPEVRWRARQILEGHRTRSNDLSADLGKAIDVLAAGRDARLLPDLLGLLEHPRVDVRYAVEYGLRRLTGRAFGYNAYAAKERRAKAAEGWRQWWKAAGKSFSFDRAREAPRQPVGVLLTNPRLLKLWVVDFKGEVIWATVTEEMPYRATMLANGHLLVAFTRRGVVEELDAAGRVVWTTKAGEFRGGVYDLQRLPSGNTLIAHSNGNRVVELDRAGTVVWSHRLDQTPFSVQRLPNGNTLVSCWRQPGKVVEITRAGDVVWSADGLMMPSRAVKLPTGNVLIAEYRAQRVIELDRDGDVVWERKCMGHPYDAFRLPDGTTVIHDTVDGVYLVRKDGTQIRQLDGEARSGRVNLVPAGAVLPRKKH